MLLRASVGLVAAPLLVLTHLDVVRPGTPGPMLLSGVVDGGYVWGRGAVDMKHIVAAAITVFRLVAESGLPLPRDLILAATADEESAGESGAGWLFRTQPQLLECELAISEGADSLRFGERMYLLIEAAEKGWLTVEIERTSRASHSSCLPRQTVSSTSRSYSSD